MGDDDPTDQQIVDYAVLDSSGCCLKSVQIKSVRDVMASRPMGVGAVVRVLARLTQQVADEYELRTNARATSPAVRLATLIHGAADIDELKAGLQQLVAIAPSVGDLVDLSREQLLRLSRCKLFFADQPIDELSKGLRDRLREYRLGRRSGVGTQGAGLLLNHLVQQVMDRATSEGPRVFSLDDARAQILVDKFVIAVSVGRYTWGQAMGVGMARVPDVRRGKILSDIEACLRQDDSTRSIRSVALTGMSGIGKSSLAAAYIADYADAYDVIVWVDATTEESLNVSAAAVLGQNPSTDHRTGDVEASFRALLESFPGQWLLVFDNATSERLVWQWTPRSGRGRIVFTSTNSGSWATAGARISVGAMEPDESKALMLRRLKQSLPESSVTPEEASVAETLASELEGWPLAMELAASYLLSTEIALPYAHQYLAQIRDRALYAEDLVPPGYPQSLGAALKLAMDRILDQFSPEVAGLALGIMRVLSYVNAHSFPVGLAYYASLLRNVPVDSPWIGVPNPNTPEAGDLNEAVRALRSQSLVDRRRVGVPSALNATAEQHVDTFTTNEIVQHVTRRLCESRGEQAVKALAGAIGVLDQCLQYHISASNFTGSSLLEGHLHAVLGHLTRLRLINATVVVAAGNLATLKSVSGRPSEALRLAELELKWLDAMALNGWPVRAQIHYMRAISQFQMGRPVAEVLQAAQAALESAVKAAENSSGHPKVETVMDGLSVLLGTLANIKKGGEEDVEHLRRDLRHQWGKMYGNYDLPTSSLDELLNQVLDDPNLALAALYSARERVGISESDKFEVDLRLAEALSLAKHFDESFAIFERWHVRLGDSGLHRGGFVLHALNAAHEFVLRSIDEYHETSSNASEQLTALLKFIHESFTLMEADAYDVIRYYTYRAAEKLTCREWVAAESCLQTASQLEYEHRDYLASHSSVRNATTRPLREEWGSCSRRGAPAGRVLTTCGASRIRPTELISIFSIFPLPRENYLRYAAFHGEMSLWLGIGR